MKALSFVLGAVAGAVLVLVIIALILGLLALRPIPQVSAAPPVSDADLVVSVDESYLTRVATGALEGQESVIHQILVDVKPDSQLDVVLEAQVKVIGLELNPKLKVIGALSVSNGEIQFLVQKFEAAGIGVPRSSLPASLLQDIESMEASFSKDFSEALGQDDLVPLGVTTDEKGMTITFKAK